MKRRIFSLSLISAFLLTASLIWQTSIAGAITATPTLTPILNAGDLGYGNVHGLVTDASNQVPIDGAVVTCSHSSYTSYPHCSGTRITSNGGYDSYYFTGVFFHDTDQITVSIDAPGYISQSVTQSFFTVADMRADFALQPINTPTPDPGTCSPVDATISAPFTQNGAGSYCWKSNNLGGYINSWNLSSLTVNGTDFTNVYVGYGSYPAQIGGYWYVAYNSTVGWGHFEAAGTGGPTNTPSISTNTPTPTRTKTPTPVSTADDVPLPDLVISSITYAGSNPSCANQPKNNVVVTNNGTAAAGTFQVSYSAGGVSQPNQIVSGLGAGQSVTLLFDSAGGAGQTVTATADSTNLVAESNENNNSNSAILPIPTQAPTCTPTPGGPTFTPTPTRTATSTPTFTPTSCAGTLVPVSVAPVTSPTSLTTQVIAVSVAASTGITVTVNSEAGSFVQTVPSGGVYNVTINLVPNSTNHLEVQVLSTWGTGCSYTYIRTTDSNGNPLNIVQTTTGGPTNTPTPTATRTNTPTPTPTSGSGGTCSPVNATISAPFTKDGVGNLCWQSSNLGSYINSWNTASVTLNGVNITNVWVGSGSYPAQIGGYWYVVYNGPYAWSHFEAK